MKDEENYDSVFSSKDGEVAEERSLSYGDEEEEEEEEEMEPPPGLIVINQRRISARYDSRNLQSHQGKPHVRGRGGKIVGMFPFRKRKDMENKKEVLELFGVWTSEISQQQSNQDTTVRVLSHEAVSM